MAKITIDQVAKAAGVSKSTVSRVLSDSPQYMKDETRQRVMEAIETLNYRPSSVARSLVSKRTHTVGLLVSDVSNPFYPQVIHGVEDIAVEHQYEIYLCNTNYDLKRGKRFIDSLVDKQVDGVILMTSKMDEAWIETLYQNHIPAVVADWYSSTLVQPMAGTIHFDFDQGIQQAVSRIVALGHKRIGHVCGPLDLWTARVRRQAFLRALQRNGIHLPAELEVTGNFQIDGGRRGLGQLLKSSTLPTVVFADNDLMALGVLWEARDRGIMVPETLSVVGLDNIALGAQVSPALTTVALPQYEIGSEAMLMLMSIIKEDSEEKINYDEIEMLIKSRLVERESLATVNTEKKGE
jgi:LacI family transcriptional regulator